MNVMKLIMGICAAIIMITAHARNVTPVQKIGLNFTATTVSDQVWGVPTLPNDTGAVGTQQYVCSTYGKIISASKFTGAPDGVLNIDAGSFFNVTAEDPVIIYNSFVNRWVISCEDLNPSLGVPYNIHLAVSGGDPLTVCTAWQMTTIPETTVNPLGGPEGSVDNQRPEFDANNTYLAIACYDASFNYVGGSAVVINTASLLAGSPIISVFPGLSPNGAGFEVSTLAVATNFDSDPAFGYFLSSNLMAPDYLTGTTLNLWRIVNAQTTSPSIFPTTSEGIQLNVQPYAISPAAYDGGPIPNKGQLFGSGGFLQLDYQGSPWQALVRNKQLFTSQSILVDSNGVSSTSGDRYATRIYQFDLTGDPTGNGGGVETESTVPALIQTITLYDQDPTTRTPKNFWNGSIMVNINGDLAVAVTVAGANDYPNVAFAGRLQSDPLGTLRIPVLATQSSFGLNLDPFQSFANGQRWGDGSSLAIDPVNGIDFWSTNIFTAVEDGWGVQATQLVPYVNPCCKVR